MCKENKTIENVFTFHNAGQGLFYSGKMFCGVFNFVFDCGSTCKKHIKKVVDKYASDITRDEIDFLVISHLHRDHFNGLVDLAKSKRIKEIYLPCLPQNKNLVKLILAYEIFCKKDAKESFEDKRILYNLMLRLYQLDPENRRYVEVIPKEHIPTSANIHYVDSNVKLSIEVINYWCFELYGKPFDEAQTNELEERLKAVCFDNNSIDITNLVCDKPDCIDKIAKIYKNVFSGNPNTTSLLLVHYPLPLEYITTRVEVSFIDTKSTKLIGEYFSQAQHKVDTTVLTGDAIDFDIYDGFADSVNAKRILCCKCWGDAITTNNIFAIRFFSVPLQVPAEELFMCVRQL